MLAQPSGMRICEHIVREGAGKARAFRRGQPGAVLQLALMNGDFGYVQYVCPGWFGSVIRVLRGTYSEPLDEKGLRRLVEEEAAPPDVAARKAVRGVDGGVRSGCE